MKKLSILAVLFFVLICGVNAQEITVFQYAEDFGRISLTLNNERASGRNNYFFTFNYVGEDYQAYRSITLTINGRQHWLLFTKIEQEWVGAAIETCRTAYLNAELITALRNANTIECSVHSVRFNNNISFSLSSNAIAEIKQFIR